MKKAWVWILLPVIGLAAIAGVFAYVERGPLALMLMQTAVERRMSDDVIGNLPDALHVILCGAGGPMPDPKRSGACVAVIADGTFFVFDAGTNGARNLNRMGLNPGRLDAIFLSHFHSDHIDGLGEMMLLRWIGGAHRAPVPVLGPQGVERVVAGFDEAYAQDAIYRTAHHGEAVAPSNGSGGRAVAFNTPRQGELLEVWNRNGVVVSAFKVDHTPVSPAVGYRIDYAGRSAVISGDTSRSSNLERVSQGVDLLVHEALSPELVGVLHRAAIKNQRAGLAKITDDILGYHTTPVQAAQIAQAIGAGHLLFYHVVPPLLLPGLDQVFLAGVSDAYSGPVTLGRDGTWVSLPANSKAIRVENFPGFE